MRCRVISNRPKFENSASDTFDAINKRELEMGAATITSLIYLIDKYGIVKKLKL